MSVAARLYIHPDVTDSLLNDHGRMAVAENLTIEKDHPGLRAFPADYQEVTWSRRYRKRNSAVQTRRFYLRCCHDVDLTTVSVDCRYHLQVLPHSAERVVPLARGSPEVVVQSCPG